MSETKYCESCGMPLDSKGEHLHGKEKDGSLNGDYCTYCYEDGCFTTDCTMDEMVEVSVKHMSESGMLKEQNKTEEEARDFMHGFFPKLKRWRKEK